MIVLDKTFKFQPSDSKTNYTVEFTLPEDYHSLRFDCEYRPKAIGDKELARQSALANIGRYVPRYQLPLYAGALERGVPLVNLITLSVDYEGKYLGCAHRHPAKQANLIAPEGSTPGFVRHAALAGQWRAMLNIHNVTSPEVSYTLTVTALKEGEAE